jgi:hypothetical protein
MKGQHTYCSNSKGYVVSRPLELLRQPLANACKFVTKIRDQTEGPAISPPQVAAKALVVRKTQSVAGRAVQGPRKRAMNERSPNAPFHTRPEIISPP